MPERHFPSSVLLIGAGNMGSALLAAWLRAELPATAITVVESQAEQCRKIAQHGVAVVPSLEDAALPACVVLAVKPQSTDDLMPQLAQLFGSKPLYLSIAAGKTLGFFAQSLGIHAAVVRAMPNTPALIGEGIAALCANENVTQMQKSGASALLEAAGEAVWLEDESQMDAVTAISGSGPAYMFLFLEALIAAGIGQGLPEDVSRQLAIATMKGSASLAQQAALPLATLRKNVTSPGGTTEAALKVLMKDDALAALVKQAVAQAVARARELA